MLCTPRLWNRLASTEISSRMPRTSTDSSMSRTLSEFLSNQPAWPLRSECSGLALETHLTVLNCRAFQSHAPRNIQAGHLVNLDHVVEHYKQKHLQDEERKVQKLSEQKA